MAAFRVLIAFAIVSLWAASVFAQVTVTPESPRWGATITITADPSASSGTDRFYQSDRLYAVLHAYRQGRVGVRDRVWVPMTWTGKHFSAELKLRHGCEVSSVGIATAEHHFPTLRRPFVCRQPDGTLPPGALITGLAWGGRDKTRWQRDIAEDLAGALNTKGRGWEYAVAWLFSWSEAKTPAADRVAEVERVERDAGATPTPELLSAIVTGYLRAGDFKRGFARLRTLAERHPHSEHTVALALYHGAMTTVRNPEFEEEVNALLAQVAKQAPENTGLRELFTRLATKSSGVPIATIRTVAEQWIADHPASSEPHYVLATALAERGGFAAEVEAETTKAIQLVVEPHPFDFNDALIRQRSFRLRAKLRAERGDRIGAIADLRMAQAVALDKAGADDMSAEAELWGELGYGRKAETLAVEAYTLGSLKAEGVLKNQYAARGGAEDGFRDYLLEKLRTGDTTPAKTLRPVPAFSATTLKGASIDPASLRGKVTVVDFWFTGCAPCAAERPKLNAIVDEIGDRARFIGFALDPRDQLDTYLRANPFNYEIVPDSEPIARAFGVDSFPTHMILDAAGNVVWIAGSDADRIERLRAMLFRVLARSGGGS